MEKITDSQRRFLDAIRDGSASTAELAEAFDISADAARNTMKRLEARGAVTGSGGGRDRRWEITDVGVDVLENGDDQDGSPVRTYYVLEETSLEQITLEALADVDYPQTKEDLLRILAREGSAVYEKVAEPMARNTEHALRSAAKSVYQSAADDPTLIAVADRNWKPTKVRIRTHRTVSVG